MIYPGIANGTIAPARFVKQDTTTNNAFLQAGSGDKVVGISQKGTRRTPYSGLDDGNAAIAGEPLRVFGPPETAPLELGGTVAAGDLLKPDANGKGITAGSDGDNYGALSPQAGGSGDIIEVQVLLGMRGA